jgi:hypothetical protein
MWWLLRRMSAPRALRLADLQPRLHLVRVNAADPISRLNATLECRYRSERQLGKGGMVPVYSAGGG